MAERKNSLGYPKTEDVIERIPSSNYDTYKRAIEREYDVLRQEIDDTANDWDVDLCRANKLEGVFGSYFTDKPAELTDEQWRAWLRAMMENFIKSPTYAVIKDKFFLLTGVNPTIEWFDDLADGWKFITTDPLYAASTAYVMVANPTTSSKTPTLKLFSEPRKKQAYRVTVLNPNGQPLLKSFMRWLMFNLKPHHVTMEIVWPEDPLGFAVGSAGTVLQWDGSSWTSLSLGITGQVNKTVMLDEERGFLFAERENSTGSIESVIFNWNGVQFVEDTDAPVGDPLYDAFITEKSTVIAVGDAPRILEYDGTAWIPFGTALPVSAVIQGVGGFASDDFWVVGNATGGNSSFWQWNGTAWTNGTYSGSATQIQSVVGIYPWLAYACGGNKIAKWDSITWADETVPGVDANTILTGVDAVDGNNVHVVGYDLLTGERKMYFYNGTIWVDESDGELGTLRDVSVITATEAYATGSKGVLIRWDGVNWSSQTSITTDDIRSIDMNRFIPRDVI